MAMYNRMQALTLSDDEDDYLLVAAIDFGTTYSGYAFSFRTNSGEIYMNKNWGSAQGQACFKTPTCVLVDGNNKFVSFGFDAESKYAQFEADAAENKSQELHLFRHFKMALFKHENSGKLSKHMTIQAVDGHVCQANKIFAMAITFLKDHLLDAVKLNTDKQISASAVKWVLTVPAIWKDDAKQFMREAALEAGLIKKLASRKLLIALEPEAASIFCRSLKTSDFKEGSGKEKLETKEGTKYFVVDAGGGTIDITAHEILSNGYVKELLPPSGGDWGGTKVDENFLRIMGDVFGAEVLTRIRTRDPTNWMRMLLAFQTVKCCVQSDTTSLQIQIPAFNIDTICREIRNEPIEKVVNSNTSATGVRFNNGILILDERCMNRLFNSVINDIVRHFESLVVNSKMASCSYVFLVGGFGNSWNLFDSLRKSSKIPVMVPPDPQTAILKGAVMFGLNTDVISSRIARRTYGLDTTAPKNQRHRTEKIFLDEDGDEWCRDLIDVLLEKNEEVNIKAVKTFYSIPSHAHQTSVCRHLIASDLSSSNFTYIDDPGVEIVGKIKLKLPRLQLKSRRDRLIKSEVTFGGTEIRLRVTDALTGTSKETTIDFLAE